MAEFIVGVISLAIGFGAIASNFFTYQLFIGQFRSEGQRSLWGLFAIWVVAMTSLGVFLVLIGLEIIF